MPFELNHQTVRLSPMSKNFEYVLTHSPCSDGFASAFIAWLHHPNSKFVGLDPRNGFPDELMEQLHGKSVIMMDIAFPRETILKLSAITTKLQILDHHKTNMDALSDLPFATFDMSRSGCGLAWQYYFPGEPMPDFLRYIELRDLWLHKDNPDALYFTSAFPNTETFEAYNQYYTNPALVAETIAKGRVQHEYIQQVTAQLASTAVDCVWQGVPMKVVNIGYPFASDVGDYLSQRHPECAIALWTKQFGQPYNYSLRSNNPKGPNVGKLAQWANGGGHNFSAGFKADLNPEQLFK